MKKRATGDRAKQSGFSIQLAATKAAPLSRQRLTALVMEMAPAGRCRPAVRGFNASNRRSTIRLKAMAQVRPLIMAARTSKKTLQPGHPC